jgi:hypothetical protein
MKKREILAPAMNLMLVVHASEHISIRNWCVIQDKYKKKRNVIVHAIGVRYVFQPKRYKNILVLAEGIRVQFIKLYSTRWTGEHPFLLGLLSGFWQHFLQN